MVQSTFYLIPETRTDLLELMRDMVKQSRKEAGCLKYEYFEGISNPNHLVLVQEWKSADCLQNHYQSRHMEEFLSQLSDFLKAPVSTRSYASQDEKVFSTVNENEKAGPEQILH
ncbi:MAG TPA: putative quinol monooxygenase [Gammaproteobacteria bacterium]|jgi:quinol monooxygenase YgiN|nr:putative quinol monooxygenase [Gammaproteobacteria bacterium]|tara:strand:+ start:220 stop:561 length:342 start_codon:yes stop_codon:yes gene_type:complete